MVEQGVRGERWRGAIGRLRNAARTLLVRTDVARWAEVARQQPTWDDRNRIIGSFIRPGSSVLDIGAGAQSLRTHLPADCRYQPADVVQNDPGVLRCDLNAKIYPSLDRKFDYVVCSGVLEYVRELRAFFDHVPQLGNTLLLSYSVWSRGQSRLRRRLHGWVNALTANQLEAEFRRVGLVSRELATWNGQVIFELRRAESSK